MTTPNAWTDSLARWRLERLGHVSFWSRLRALLDAILVRLGIRKPSNVVHMHEWTRGHEAAYTARMRSAMVSAAKAMDEERRKQIPEVWNAADRAKRGVE